MYRRPQRPRSMLATLATRLAIGALALLALAGVAVLLFFNGNSVKDPLLRLLTSRTALPVQIGEVQFSPLYPDTLKLLGVRLSKSRVGELYIEYDLPALLSGKRLVVRDLVARGVQIHPDDAPLLATERLGLGSISVSSFSLQGPSAVIGGVELSDFSVSGEDLEAAAETRLGRASLSLGSAEGQGLRLGQTAAEFSYAGGRLRFSDLSTHLLGGTLEGSGELDPGGSRLGFDRLLASRLVLRGLPAALSGLSISAPTARVQDLVIDLGAEDMVLSGISGTVESLSLRPGALPALDFSGSAGELSLPRLGFSITSLRGEASSREREISASLEGQALEGKASATLRLDPQAPRLRVDSLTLGGARIEPTAAQAEAFLALLRRLPITLGQARVEGARFISHLDHLPLSVEQASASLGGCTLTAGGLEPAPTLTLSLDLGHALYHDLPVRALRLTHTRAPDSSTWSVPYLTLQKSSLSLTGSFSPQGGQSLLSLSAHGFNPRELHSSLFPPLMSGSVSFSADLKGTGMEQEFMGSASGTLEVEAKQLLVAALGLDLLNGGDQKQRTLPLPRLYELLKAGDVGIFGLTAKGRLQAGSLSAAASFDTAISRASWQLQLPREGGFTSTLSIESMGQDSVTEVRAQGQDPLRASATIRPVRRGEPRPGLFGESGTQAP
ncbi:MAG: AsmA-like C-terminal region-containing protein [Succinivibrionaceae bacterium]|nr:AsmA-like C-terminal region-containing protein [Succinivibrionaceae bacterium]